VPIETQGREDENGFLPKSKSWRNLKAQVTPVARKQSTNTQHGQILASIGIKDTESASE